MIKFHNIAKIYPASAPDLKPTIALDNISFKIEKGEFVSIVGKSGAGKTTLIRLLLALEEPTCGDIFLDEVNIHKIKPKELQRARRKMGVVYQDYRLLCGKTAYENIAYVMAVKGMGDEEISKKVPQAIELVDLADKIHNFPAELSGGEQQRLAIARAVVTEPDVLIADEPTGNLDPYNTYEVISLLKKINEMGKTVILSTHDKEVVDQVGKRVVTLEKGRIVRDEEKGRFIL